MTRYFYWDDSGHEPCESRFESEDAAVSWSKALFAEHQDATDAELTAVEPGGAVRLVQSHSRCEPLPPPAPRPPQPLWSRALDVLLAPAFVVLAPFGLVFFWLFYDYQREPGWKRIGRKLGLK